MYSFILEKDLLKPNFKKTFFFTQNAIAMHESNGIDIIIALLLNEINPLGKHRMDLVLKLKVSTVII